MRPRRPRPARSGGRGHPHVEVYGLDPRPRRSASAGRATTRAAAWASCGAPASTRSPPWCSTARATRSTTASRARGFLFGTDGNRIHEVRLCDELQPGRTYSYRVGGAGGWSAVHTFRTPEAPGTFDTFRVAFVGDSRGAYETWSFLVQAAAAQDPDFILFTGDAVGSGSSQAEWDAWFRAMGDVPAEIPVVFAHGNHEGLSQNYFAQVMQPGNEQWFTIKYGNLHLVVLNDTVDWGSDDLEVEARYIDRSFAEAVPGYVGAAAHHQGMYASCLTHRSNTVLRDLWVPHYDAAGVRLVFNGHNHIYERSVPIRGDVEVQPAAGATYLTAGGAGASLYPQFDETEWFLHTAVPKHHFGIADFGPGGIHVVVRDAAGTVIDVFDR
ncbi:MAG: metallophosphoesterase family protein [Myxococcota bacterium]